MNLEFDLEAEPFELSPSTCGPKCSCNHCREHSGHTGEAFEDPELSAELGDSPAYQHEEDQFELDQPPNPRLEIVSHFPSHQASVSSLPVVERQKIDRVARFVASGLRSGRESIRTIRLTGHADLDTPRRPAFEQQVARARAHEV